MGGWWINPLQTLPQGLVFTFDFDFDPDPDPELDNMGLGSENFQFAQLEQELWPFLWRGVNRKFGSFWKPTFFH